MHMKTMNGKYAKKDLTATTMAKQIGFRTATYFYEHMINESDYDA